MVLVFESRDFFCEILYENNTCWWYDKNRLVKRCERVPLIFHPSPSVGKPCLMQYVPQRRRRPTRKPEAINVKTTPPSRVKIASSQSAMFNAVYRRCNRCRCDITVSIT